MFSREGDKIKGTTTGYMAILKAFRFGGSFGSVVDEKNEK